MAKAKLIEKSNRLRSIKNKNFYRTRISQPRPVVKVLYTLPFRIKITNIGIEGYGPNNVPGIGIQVIEYNNYIL